jgi:hypothetical protein
LVGVAKGDFEFYNKSISIWGLFSAFDRTEVIRRIERPVIDKYPQKAGELEPFVIYGYMLDKIDPNVANAPCPPPGIPIPQTPSLSLS